MSYLTLTLTKLCSNTVLVNPNNKKNNGRKILKTEKLKSAGLQAASTERGHHSCVALCDLIERNVELCLFDNDYINMHIMFQFLPLFQKSTISTKLLAIEIDWMNWKM